MLSALNPGNFVVNLCGHEGGFGHVNFVHDEVIQDIRNFFSEN